MAPSKTWKPYARYMRDQNAHFCENRPPRKPDRPQRERFCDRPLQQAHIPSATVWRRQNIQPKSPSNFHQLSKLSERLILIKATLVYSTAILTCAEITYCEVDIFPIRSIRKPRSTISSAMMFRPSNICFGSNISLATSSHLIGPWVSFVSCFETTSL